MSALEALEVLVVGLITVLVALGVAASALKLLLARFRERTWQTAVE